jgi:hypothetical protein
MEYWKDLKGYEGIYKININGDIKSLIRNSTGTNTRKETFLKPFISKNGYKRVALSKNSKTIKYLLHRLIAIHFIENPNNLKVINHKDGDKLNNELSNLEWCTHSYNSKHGFESNGRKIHLRKLKESEVLEIRDKLLNYKRGMVKQLAHEYNVTIWIISLIKNNKTYKNI